jgi:hypothetical protein
MSRFDRRINAVIRKTHDWISVEDYSLIREYWKELFDKELKPDDFDEKVKELARLDREFHPVSNPSPRIRVEEIINSSQALRWWFLLTWIEDECERFPKGCWKLKSFGAGFERYVSDAKAHFKRKREDEERQSKLLS